VLEGVAFALRDGLDALLASGSTIGEITVIGGGARSSYWGKVLSAVLGRALTYRDGGTVGPAFGAARLARLGVDRAAIEDVCVRPSILHVAEPDDRLANHYAKLQPRFRELYQSLKGSFSEART
jgi:xylulokinase